MKSRFIETLETFELLFPIDYSFLIWSKEYLFVNFFFFFIFIYREYNYNFIVTILPYIPFSQTFIHFKKHFISDTFYLNVHT